jgi:hypothetical protein
MGFSFEESGDHGRIQVGADAVDDLAVEVDDPSVSVVEPHAVFGRRQGMKLHHGLVVLDDQMLRHELGPIREHLAELGERAGDELGLGFVGASKRMGAHHSTVDVIDVLEEARAVAVLQTFEEVRT